MTTPDPAKPPIPSLKKKPTTKPSRNPSAEPTKDAASKPGKPGEKSSASGLMGKIPVGNNADLSKGQKAKGLVSGAVKGAQGKNAAGLAAGGQLTGAVAGAAQALVSQTKARTLIIFAALGLAGPWLILFAWIILISSVLGSTFSDSVAGASQAVSTSTGVTSSALETVQNASMYSPTPWTILEATIYYETGVGATVAQQVGACPAGSPAHSLCPATLSFLPGSLTSGGAGSSSQGSAPSPSADSGFDPSVGRNGTVSTVLAPNLPDWTTTDTADWDCIRQAESGDNYTDESGAYGFLPSTWASLGLPGTPGEASKATQNAAALEILNYEGHFYGAWNDLCTDPTGGPNGSISYIPPGVPHPPNYGSAPTANVTDASATTAASSTTPSSVPDYGGGVCPIIKNHPNHYGPYCLLAGTLSTTDLETLGASSDWVAKTMGKTLTTSGIGDEIDLTAGMTSTDSGLPQMDPGSNVALNNEKVVLSALAALPIEYNSSAMDKNIYKLAVSWSNGYSPVSSSTCASSVTAAPPATSIPAPPNGSATTEDLLSSNQVVLADEIVSDATTDGASQTTQIAAVTAALALSNLVQTDGIFDNGNTNVSSAVSLFVKANLNSTAAADAQAYNALGGPIATYTVWIPGATQLVDAGTSATSACGVSVPFVEGGSPAAQAAVKAAEAELGRPYVWGGGGTAGPSGSASAPPSQVGEPGFDCSGLVQYSFAQAGVSLPRTANEQIEYVETNSTLTMNTAQLQPGDLVFFSDNEPGGANHVAIYLGDGNIIQAPQTGQDVSYYTLAGDMPLGFLGGGAAA